MREVAREIIEFTRDVTADAFSNNKILRYAVERELAVIGEAARQVSTSFRLMHSEIAWDTFISRRNLIIHHYGEIKPDRLWRVITNEIPSLIVALEPLIPPAPPE